MALLNAIGVKAYYSVGDEFIKAVDGVNVTVQNEEILGIVGETGCGKSTLGKTLMMNVRPPLRFIAGQIFVDGVGNLAEMELETIQKKVWGKIISQVPQSALNALVPTWKVQKFVQEVLCYHLDISKKEATNLASKRFEELGLPVECLGKYPHELSGGMRQRVTVAIATLLNPKLLIADEPTSALDVSSQKQVLKMFKRILKEHVVGGIILITHDIATLRQIADRIIVMYAGKVVEVGSMNDILFKPFHPYTKSLIGSIVTPEPEVKARGLSYIPGEPPDLLNPPSGCRFRLRCNYAAKRCSEEEPEMIEVENGHFVACYLFSNGSEQSASTSS